MERKKASDFPQELLNLFDGYVHGGISRRAFFDGAQKFAVGGVTAAALFRMLKPNYAWAIQVPPDDKRIKATTETVPSPQGYGSVKGYLVRPANDAKLRPEFGRFSTCAFATVKDRSPVCDWIIGASPDTSTVSASVPTSRVRVPTTTRSPGTNL